MKTKSILLAIYATAALVCTSNAATVTVSRGLGNPGIMFTDMDGTPLAAGGYYLAVGSFAEVPVTIPGDLVSLSAAVASFKIFAYATSPVTGATKGTFTAQLTGVGAPDPSDFNAQEMYFMMGNAPTQAASNQFTIFRLNPARNFPANVTVTGATAVSMPNVSVVDILPGFGVADAATNTIRSVPETSVALLGALGALGLLRRRR